MNQMMLANPDIDVQSMPSKAAPHQMHSFVLVYSRLPSLVVMPPVVAIAIPVMFFLLNSITYGHSIHLVAVAMLLWQVGIMAIHRFSSQSAEALDKALTDNEMRLPAMALAASAVILAVVTRFTGETLAWRVPVSVLAGFFLRVCFGILLLEIGISMRYVGPLSIMRCSSVPLISNPFASSMHYLIAYPGSIFQPDEVPGEGNNYNATSEHRGRRSHHPSFAATVMQIIILGVSGSVMFMGVFFQSPHGSAGLTACLLIQMSPLLNYVGQHNHELDPRLYLDFPSAWSWDVISSSAREACFLTALVLAVAVVVEYSANSRVGWSLMFAFQLASFVFLCLWGQKAWETCLRLVLFYPRSDLTTELLDMNDGSHSECVRSMLQCFLTDTSLVEDICTVDRTSIEKTELDRVRNFCENYGKQLLRKMPHYVEAPLEEDVIRFGILEALGGVGSHGRHERIIANWLNVNVPLTHGGGTQEPPCVTLVRGLCVVVGGMGEALRNIAFQAKHRPHTKRQLDKWELSAAGLLSLEYSLRALKRLFSQRVSQQRISQQLQKLFPAALASIFKLHVGLAECREGQGLLLHPELVDAVSVICEQTATHIKTRVSGSFSSLGQDVLAWLNGPSFATAGQLEGSKNLGLRN